MKDGFGRSITYLRLSVTDLCDLRCRYCMPEKGVCKKEHTEMLSEEEMIRVVEAGAFLGIKKLRITGGEPLVKRNILSICEKAAKVDGIEELCITTNGVKLPGLARPLKEAGVTRINISLDTLNPEKYAYITRRGCLNDALKGLESALSAGFSRVKINTVLIGGFNDEEIIPLAELTRKYPVDVRFIELMPMYDGGDFGQDAFISCDVVLKALPDLIPLNKDEGVSRMYCLPGSQGRVGLIRPLSHQFCGDCSRIRVTADGKLKPCLHGAEEFSLKGLTKQEMIEVIRQAILSKPFCHGELSAKKRSLAGRNMNQIGG